MTLISIRQLSLSLLFVGISFLSCRLEHPETTEEISKRVDIEAEKEKMLKRFYDQDDESLSQLKEYLFRDVDLLKEVFPHRGKYSLWSIDSIILPRADSLISYLNDANLYGLQPHWYHYQELVRQRNLLEDSSFRYDPIVWTRFEVMMSNAFVGFAQDIRYGRLKADSIDQRKVRMIEPAFLSSLLDSLLSAKSMNSLIKELEPSHSGYLQIKNLLREFYPTMDQKKYSIIVYPWRDSLLFLRQLHRRMSEEGFVDSATIETDSLKMSISVRKAQEYYGLKKDGKAGRILIAALNDWDLANYARMAINLDRYRMLPDSFPESYIMVNIPSYTLTASYKDTLVFSSKVIVGKPKTRSPLLNAQFSSIVVYPQWNVPTSIIFKEIIPKMQKNLSYLKSQNMVILDKKDSIVDPARIAWSKANERNFHYRIRQGEGLDNSLGIIKFNFRNPYDVYLHDTNVRSLFKLDDRSLSHGCIRVEKWQQVSDFLSNPSLKPAEDTIVKRLLSMEKKATRALRRKTDIYIRYFTLIDSGEGLKFYPDLYGEDNQLIDSYLY